jgi:hypothetical protein
MTKLIGGNISDTPIKNIRDGSAFSAGGADGVAVDEAVALIANFDVTGTLFALGGNAAIDSSRAPSFATNALQLDGTNDNATYSNFLAVVPANTAACIEAFVYSDLALASPTTTRNIVSWGPNGTTGWRFCYDQTFQSIALLDGNSNVLHSGNGNVPAQSTWTHVAACRNAAGNWGLFVGGTRYATASDATALGSSTGNLIVGEGYAGDDWDGAISRLVVSIGYTPYDPTISTLLVPNRLAQLLVG